VKTVFRERRFKLLLRLMPGAFREEHEREMLRVWKDEAGDAAREGRRRYVWTEALKDTLRVAPREHAAIWSRNLRFAARSLRRSPALAVAAISTLALGIGATAGVFTLVNAVLLRPLPWTDPDRVGILWSVQPSGERTWLSLPELEELQRDVPAFAGVCGLTDLRPTLLLDGGGQEIQALAVSHQFFRVLGVVPRLGRDFSAEDDRDGAAPAAVLSDAFWRAQFGANPAIVGRRIRLNEREYAVIGILPADFALLPASTVLPDRVDVWLPLATHLPARDRSVRFLHVLARLRPDVSFSHAADELEVYGRRVSSQFPTVYRGGRWRFTIQAFKQDVLQGARTALSLIFGLVLLVLLMACANVANLLLARGEARRAELAVRTALGAGPARLAGELLAEALVLAAAASALGFALAAAVPRMLRTLDPGALPRLDGANVDLRVTGFFAAVTLVTTAIFVCVPLVERARLGPPGAALAGRSGGRTRRSARIGRAVVVFQTALATTVAIVALFLSATFEHLHGAELGFATDSLLTARISLSPRYTEGADAARFFESATAVVGKTSGIVGAAAISQLPLSGAMLGSTFVVEQGPDGRRVDADLRGVTPDYFDIVGTRVIQGRAFTGRDRANTPAVAIVDELFARRLSTGGNVVGRRVRWIRQPGVDIEIVGVVRPVRHRGPAEPPRETVYRPFQQHPRSSMFLVAKTRFDAAAAAESMRAAVRTVDPTQPLADVFTMRQRLEKSVARARTSLMLAGALAALALSLGVIGIYGVLAFGVAQRLREFGVRMALGATPAAVRRLVVREGLLLTLMGTAAGAAGAALVASAVRTTLYGTGAMDVRQYVLGIGIVLLPSLLAFWVPARRASAADLNTVLRAE
jgi:putative ABC transport system permease protein